MILPPTVSISLSLSLIHISTQDELKNRHILSFFLSLMNSYFQPVSLVSPIGYEAKGSNAQS